MIPSLDAYLIPKMGFRRDTKRLPITGQDAPPAQWRCRALAGL